MSYNILPTTAEHIINVTDAVLLKQNGCDWQFVAQFLDITEESAKNALEMASQLKLIKHISNGCYNRYDNMAIYLVTGNQQQRAAVLRFVLEQYEPYKTFKNRLAFSGSVHIAAEQTKMLFGLSAHRDQIKDTIISLGTYAHSLVSEGAGLYRIVESNPQSTNYLHTIGDIISDRETAEITIRRSLGTDVCDWLNDEDILSSLATAYHKLAECSSEPRGPILYAGNAIESFLVKLALHHRVSISGANGINAKVDRIKQAGCLNTKYAYVLKYLGHVRNACDHGIDHEIGQAWGISSDTSKEYVYVALTCLKNVVNSIVGGRYKL